MPGNTRTDSRTAEGCPGNARGTVAFGGITQDTSLAFVPEAKIGDGVIVHAGLAISRIDAEEAQRTIAVLQQIADLSGTSGAD